MLLGQTGMLSFGHAVYYGLGAFFVVHAMNAIIRARYCRFRFRVMPLVGGIAGLVFAIIFGSVSTRRGGTAFAMISLGLAELVASSSLILRGFFGGEEGITTNRTRLFRILRLEFRPQIQVYYLIAAWCIVCMIAMYALTRTPFGRMCNAVRENPERVEFIGYSPTMVRFIAFCLSGFFAGIAGGLAAINFEIVNASYVGVQQSGVVLLAAYIGGIGHFIGPVLGAILVTYLQIMLSDVTEIWQLYFGLMFIAVVMFAPGGLAGLLMMHAPSAARARAAPAGRPISSAARRSSDRRGGRYPRNRTWPPSHGEGLGRQRDADVRRFIRYRERVAVARCGDARGGGRLAHARSSGRSPRRPGTTRSPRHDTGARS